MKLTIFSLLLASTVFAGPPPPKPSSKAGSSGSYPSPNTQPAPKPAPGSGSYPSGSGSYPSGSGSYPSGSGSYQSGSGSYPSGPGSYTAPSNDELCGCYDIDLICDPFINHQGEMCYYYQVIKSSDNTYCKPIEYLSLGTGNLDECGLTSTDIQSSVADFAPKCYDIDPLYDGTCNNGKTGVPGIKVKVNPPAPPSGQQPPPPPKSGSGSGSYPSGSSPSGSYPSGSPPPPPKSGSGSSYPSGSPPPPPKSGSYPTNGGQQPPPPPKESSEFMVFSICFDPLSVSGVQENGQISIKTGSGRSTCDAMHILPNFCDDDMFPDATTTTVAPEIDISSTIPAGPAPEVSNPVQVTLQPSITEEARDDGQCTSTDALNIGFLLDESGSIDSTEWDIITNVVQRIIENDVSAESYVSLWEFASLPGFKQFLDWTGPRKDEQDKMIRSLTNNRYNPSGQTETWDAVNRVLDNFHDYKQNCGDNCYQRQDVLFLITDAEPTDKAGAPRETCPYMTDRMLATDIDVIIILVDPNDIIDPSKVSCLDARDGGVDIITIKSFHDIVGFEAQIREKICSGNYPLSDGVRPAANPWMYDNGEYGLGPVPDRNGNSKHGKADPEPQAGSHQASGNEENMDNMEHKHDASGNDTDNNVPWIPIIAGVIFVGLLIIGVVSFLICKSEGLVKLNRNIEIISVKSPGDDEEISVQDEDNQVYGNINDEGNANASIIMV